MAWREIGAEYAWIDQYLTLGINLQSSSKFDFYIRDLHLPA